MRGDLGPLDELIPELFTFLQKLRLELGMIRWYNYQSYVTQCV